MKKLLLLAASLVVAVGAYAQGTVNFSNGASGVNAPVTNGQTGALVAPANGVFYAALYVGASSDAVTALQLNGGAPIQIGTASAGYFFGGTRTITGFAPGTTVTVQVRAWNGALGAASFPAGADPALRSGQGFATSAPIQVGLGGGTIPNPNLTGLTAMTIAPVIVPEPSSIALGLLGLGALALIRRRK